MMLVGCTTEPPSSSADGGSATTASPTSSGSTRGTPSDDTTTTPVDTTASATDESTGQADSTGNGSSGDTEVTYSVELRLLTDSNRAYRTMYGGWGPHLRGVMRDADDVLWFCADQGPDVSNNAAIDTCASMVPRGHRWPSSHICPGFSRIRRVCCRARLC